MTTLDLDDIDRAIAHTALGRYRNKKARMVIDQAGKFGQDHPVTRRTREAIDRLDRMLRDLETTGGKEVPTEQPALGEK